MAVHKCTTSSLRNPPSYYLRAEIKNRNLWITTDLKKKTLVVTSFCQNSSCFGHKLPSNWEIIKITWPINVVHKNLSVFNFQFDRLSSIN